MSCTQIFRTLHLTTKSIFTSIIWFPEILCFLLGGFSSISSTLHEDNEDNVSTNVSMTVGTTTLIMQMFKLLFFDSLSAVGKLIPVITLLKISSHS